MRGHVRSFALVAACGSVVAFASQPAFGRGWRENAPWALASSPALRGLPLSHVLCTALVTDAARAAIAVHAPAGIIAALLRFKADILLPKPVVARDRVVLHVAPKSMGEQDDVPEVVLESLGRIDSPPVAVVLSPAIFVSPAVLERYGAALVAGMHLWQEYRASLASVAPPPLPSKDTVLSKDDCLRLDRLMIVLGKLCEVASILNFDVALSLVETEQNRRAASVWRRVSQSNLFEQARQVLPEFAAFRRQKSDRSFCNDVSESERPSPDFNRAIAVAYIATCLARSYADPDASKGVFPSILLSADTTKDMHAVELLADQTLVKLSMRLAPGADYLSMTSALGECAVFEPAVLAVPGCERIPASQSMNPPALEYTRGIGDLHAARLAVSVRNSTWSHSLAPQALVRREFAGARNQLYASTAHAPLARKALREESRALWTRARILLEQSLL